MIKVLLSTYNGEKYIEEQIESILAQDCEKELIVRDDGSKDGTRDILERYRSEGKLTWYTGDNLGCAKSFWQMLQNSGDADYYAFSDQDDVWDSDKLSAAITQLSECDGSEPVLYIGTARVTDKYLNVISGGSKTKFRGTFGESLIRSVGPGCTFVFNKTAKDLLTRYDAEGIDIHDWTAHKIVAAFGKIIIDYVPHMSYRQHGNNVIGAEGRGFKAKWKKIKRFWNGDGTNVRLKSAEIIAKYYYDDMNKKNQKILTDLIGYKKNLRSKIRLIRNKDVKTNDKATNLKLDILILTGKI